MTRLHDILVPTGAVTNYYLIGFKAHSMTLNSCLSLLVWPRNWDEIGHGPKGKITTGLLKGKKNSTMTPTDYSAILIDKYLTQPSFGRWDLTQRPTTGQTAAKSKRPWNAQSYVGRLYQTSPFMAQGKMWKRRLNDHESQRDWKVQKNCLSDTTGLPHIWTPRPWQYSKIQPKWSPSAQRENGYELPSLT